MKPSIPKGTRDFTPEQALRRNYIFGTIRQVFEQFGYAPIETPAMELLQVLTGKYGEEGDKLLFKVLNNGDYLSKADQQALSTMDSNALTPSIAKRGLRYDLTVPFARFVVMHQHEIQFPFKRYQIQPVWRADRPQKGRYQEFYQCDADVVGSESLIYEAEFIQIYTTVFEKLGIDFNLHVNNRKILAGLAEVAGIPDRFMDMTMTLDKLDKIGRDGVRNELTEKGMAPSAVNKIVQVSQTGNDLETLKKMLQDSPIALEGIQEVETSIRLADPDKILQEKIKFDITLARGLNYYTGCIFEAKATGVSMGSIGGGGRYDELTAAFGLPNVPGIGISFGAERIYDVMEELNLFPENLAGRPAAIFLAMDDPCLEFAFSWATLLRQKGINVDLYPEPSRMKKQMKYAGDRGFKYALICGPEELNAGVVSVKNMLTGTQQNMSFEEVYELLIAC